ncbi:MULTISPECIES: histidinol dehydrogenase [Gammaproteobacteria]|uniref:histidinol dehydrogenase n=1 Tax=Gammaproteobacteria TaxID=1236 RepID=UPI000DD0EC41|nr:MULTISPECIES: histidinol dehydrogenase [Gammaproteobacteria]RTE87615.1 histidinol dehydrogenase [Aliidiomarina sp. B3213]TCZ92600.1 histidinol dehydrogenase [Lysobacter sp. N42]
MLNIKLPSPTVWASLASEQQQELLQRPTQKVSESLSASVANIMRDVKQSGDKALLSYTEKFDGVRLSTLALTKEAIASLAAQTSLKVRKAIDEAYQNIAQFHNMQKPQEQSIETSAGVTCSLRYTPLAKVGLYIPGGSASLPSTVLMLGVPSQIAGCDEVILMTPPTPQGEVAPAICYAAQKCGISKILLGGGAQAIAAMTFGTETVPAVQKIFGPGNSYVTEAKQQASQVAGGPAIDLPAGPSELLVIADESAEPEFIASDLLSQAEHGPDSQVILVSSSAEILKQTAKALERQLSNLPRAEIAIQAMEQSRFIHTSDLEEAVQVSELYAPEHLSLQVSEPEALLPNLRNAGSIFIGHYTPEAGGDYATGTNHVLPTYGFSRSYSSLGLADFYRRYTTQRVTAAGLKQLGTTIVDLAEEEKLDAHARAVSLRLQSKRMQADLGEQL